MNIWSKILLTKKQEVVEPEEKIKVVNVLTQANRFDPQLEEIDDPNSDYQGIIHLYNTSARHMVFYPEVTNDSLTNGYAPYEDSSMLNSNFSVIITIPNGEERNSWMHGLANGKDENGDYVLRESIMQIVPVVEGVKQISNPVATYLIQFHGDKESHLETEV